MKLSIVLATRRRPGLLFRVVEETLKHITHPETKLLICADDDDDGTRSMQDKIKDPRVIWSFKPREDTVGEKYNRVLTEAPADVYMVMVDYAPCVSGGFDQKILDAARVYPDGYAVILNWLANPSFSQLNAVTHKLAVKMGGIYPEYFPYWFVDHWLEDVAKQIGRQVFVDVVMDCRNKQPTMEYREPALWADLFDMLTLERRELARSIIDVLDETPARKAALIRNEPLTRDWSSKINEEVRKMPEGSVDPNDERYMRVRKRAQEIIARIQPTILLELGLAEKARDAA